VNGIAFEIASVDLGSDDGLVLGITLAAAAAADADADGRREDDMAQNAALRGHPARGNVLRLVQLDLGLLVLLVHCRVVLPLNHPNTPLLILGGKCLASDLGLDRSEVLVERRIAEKSDVITALGVVLTLEVFVFVLALVQRENDVASGDEEKPLGIPALRNEEAAGTLSPRRRPSRRPSAVVRGSWISTVGSEE